MQVDHFPGAPLFGGASFSVVPSDFGKMYAVTSPLRWHRIPGASFFHVPRFDASR
jgi:hypothetical protein